MAENKAYLLFTSEDLGAVFTDEVYADLLQTIAAMMRDVAESWRIPQRYQLLALGLAPHQHTSPLEKLANTMLYVYVLEHHQFITLSDLLYAVDCYLNGPVEQRKLALHAGAAAVEPVEPVLALEVAPPTEAGAEAFTIGHSLHLMADQLRYRQKSPVLTDKQRGQMLGQLDKLIADGNAGELGRMVAKLDELELKTVSPTRSLVIKELDQKCRILLSHVTAVPDNWRTTMVPRLSDALQRTDDAALTFLQTTLQQLLQFHFESLPTKQLRSLYELKYGQPE
jgi:hypothetical protein